jgi:hypothetical protein
MISLIHPSRGRPQIARQTLDKWWGDYIMGHNFEHILSIDVDDPAKEEYEKLFPVGCTLIQNSNRSAVDAINNAAKVATGDILMVVSDDTEPCPAWYEYIYHEANGRKDWILKTQDGIQPYIITMPIMDRAYYNRTGYIYYPTFDHMFCDTYLTCVADITGRKITSNLLFPHRNDSIKDDLRKRTDSTWKQGEDLFIKLMKEFSPEERARITDSSMKNWLRNKGVR